MDFFTEQLDHLERLDSWLRSQEPLVYRNLAQAVVNYVERVGVLGSEMESLLKRERTWKASDLAGLFGSGKAALYRESLEEQAAFAWDAWKQIRAEVKSGPRSVSDVLRSIATDQPTQKKSVEFKDEGFRLMLHGVLVSPIIVYLQGALTRRITENHVLVRYRQKVEWFRREEVGEIFAGNTRTLEDRLQAHLYEHMFDAGLPFVAEAQGPSGKADFMGLQPEGRRFLGEVKIYSPERSKTKSYVLGGYPQVRRYMREHGERVGYLVIFSDSTNQLHLVDLDEGAPLPAIKAESTTVYVLVVQVTKLGSASKGTKRKVVSLTKHDFLTAKTKVEE